MVSVISAISASLSTLSVLACAWMTCRLRTRVRHTVLARPLLSLVICEGVFEAWVTSFQLPPALGHSGNVYEDFDKRLCIALACVGQFSEVAAALWFTVVAWMVMQVLVGKASCESLGAAWPMQNVCVWGIATVFMLVPLFSHAYGPVIDTGAECWISDNKSPFRLFFYGAIFVNLLFCIAVLIIVQCRWQYFSTLPNLLRKMSRWVFCFVAVWTLPLVRRIVQLLGHSSPWNMWLGPAHQLCVSLCGCATFLAWYSSEAAGVRAGATEMEEPPFAPLAMPSEHTDFFSWRRVSDNRDDSTNPTRTAPSLNSPS